MLFLKIIVFCFHIKYFSKYVRIIIQMIIIIFSAIQIMKALIMQCFSS